MSEQFEDRLRAIIARALQTDVPRAEVQREGRALKKDMSLYVAELSANINTLDQIIFKYARDPSWEWGWATADVTTQQASSPPPTRKYNRARRTLEIAAEMGMEALTVHVSDISERLRAEGEELGERPLATAVGNLLTRSGHWRRVAPGEYAATIAVDSSNGSSGWDEAESNVTISR